MKLKNLGGLFVFLLGILVIPIISVKAEAERVYEVITSGAINYNFNGADSSSSATKYYNDSSEGITTTYKTEAELNSAVETARQNLTKWAASNNIPEEKINIIVTTYNRLIKEENGVVTWVENESEATKIITDKRVNLNANITLDKDTRTAIDKVEISGIKTDYKVGDTPVFGAKVGNDAYTIVEEIWCEEYISTESEGSGFGSMPCHSSNEETNKDNKAYNAYFEKFESGKIYKYSITFKLSDGLKYKFTKDSKVYLNGKVWNYNNSLYEYNYFSIYTLDFASKTIDEKNSVAIEDQVNNVLGSNLYTEEHTGLTDELAEEIKVAKRAGKEVTTKLDIAKVSDEDKKAIDEKIKDKVTSDMKIVSYMDITIPVLIDGEEKGFITKLANDVKLTIEVPESIPEVAKGYERTYAVIRLHDGEITVLPVTINDDGTLSFETDRFSDYILTYTDTEVPVEETADSTANPNTLDNISVSFILAGVSVIGLLSVRKLREN